MLRWPPIWLLPESDDVRGFGDAARTLRVVNRVVIEGTKIQIYVGPVNQATLEVRKLGQLDGGQVGLWVGNVSGGDFANLVITNQTP